MVSVERVGMMIRLALSLRTYLYVLMVLFLVSCGGGTNGTGDLADTRIFGTLKNESGLAIANAEVTVLETGDSATTDSSGVFRIDTQIPGTDAKLLIRDDKRESTVQLTKLPGKKAQVNLELTFSEKDNIVSIVSITIEADTVPAAQPTPRPSPRQTPSSVGSTPESTLIFRGKVLYWDGSPIQGVVVRVSGFKASSVSDASGSFQLQIKGSINSAALLLAFHGASGRVALANLPIGGRTTVSLVIRTHLLPPGQLCKGLSSPPENCVDFGGALGIQSIDGKNISASVDSVRVSK